MLTTEQESVIKIVLEEKRDLKKALVKKREGMNYRIAEMQADKEDINAKIAAINVVIDSLSAGLIHTTNG
jgi:aconitase B